MKTNKNLKRVIKTLKDSQAQVKKEYKAEITGVFGSYVRGEQKKASDLDILVRFIEGATLLDLVGVANFLEEKLNIKVDIVPIDAIRNEIKEQVLSGAVYL